MDRKIYLEMCQKSAFCVGNKKKIPADIVIDYSTGRYYPEGYQLTFDKNGKAKHTAILHDIVARSVLYVDLEKI